MDGPAGDRSLQHWALPPFRAFRAYPGTMTVGGVQELPMSWADYQVLGEEICSEPIDGLLVLSPLPSRQHQNASRQVMNHLEAHAPDGYEVAEGGCKPRADEYPPDVMGHPCAEEQT